MSFFVIRNSIQSGYFDQIQLHNNIRNEITVCLFACISTIPFFVADALYINRNYPSTIIIIKCPLFFHTQFFSRTPSSTSNFLHVVSFRCLRSYSAIVVDCCCNCCLLLLLRAASKLTPNTSSTFVLYHACMSVKQCSPGP